MPLNCKPVQEVVINYYTQKLFEERVLAESFNGFIEILNGNDEFKVKKEILMRACLIDSIYNTDLSIHDAISNSVGAIYAIKNDIIKFGNQNSHPFDERIKLMENLLNYQDDPNNLKAKMFSFFSYFSHFCYPDLFPIYDFITTKAWKIFITHPKIVSRYPGIPKPDTHKISENYGTILEFYNFLISNCFTDLDEVSKECGSQFRKHGLIIKLTKLRMLDKYFWKTGLDLHRNSWKKDPKLDSAWVELVTD